MHYGDLYLRLTNPGKLIAKALNFTCLKHMEYKVDILYNLIGKGIEWTLREFDYINQALNLNLSISDMDEAFEYWDQKGLKFISLP